MGLGKCHFSAIKILLELIAWNNSGGGILYCKPSVLMVLEKRVKIDFPTENPRSVERPQGCFHLEWKRLEVAETPYQERLKPNQTFTSKPNYNLPRKDESNTLLSLILPVSPFSPPPSHSEPHRLYPIKVN